MYVSEPCGGGGANVMVYVVHVDFVYGDYSDHVVVVCVDVCGCCVHACNGDLLVLRKCMIVCMCVYAE